jgi:hypothetical protein
MVTAAFSVDPIGNGEGGGGRKDNVVEFVIVGGQCKELYEGE